MEQSQVFAMGESSSGCRLLIDTFSVMSEREVLPVANTATTLASSSSVTTTHIYFKFVMVARIKGFQCSTSTDIGTALKTIGLMHLVWGSYTPNMKCVQVIILQILRLRASITDINTHTHTGSPVWSHRFLLFLSGGQRSYKSVRIFIGWPLNSTC